ncbi:MAG: gliding motility-associated C-terminal domain-containing protein, partial [Bacteroidia bacterium]
SFTLDRYTGQLVWKNAPPYDFNGLTLFPAIFNIAIRVSEFRHGDFIGYVVRDMQIIVNNCVDNPPVIDPLPALCQLAGSIVQFNLSASDVDYNPTIPNPTKQLVTLEGYGAPFSSAKYPAFLTPAVPNGNPVNAQFTWQTDCNDIMYESYKAYFRATDDYYLPMTNENFATIKVIGPAPQNVKIKQIGDGFQVSWNKDICGLAYYYKIYKKIDPSNWNPSACQTGIDLNASKFVYLDSIHVNNTPHDTFYYDNNFGAGLTPLVDYCYRIVAYYPSRTPNGTIIFGKDAESYASTEICAEIIRNKPIITNVSVRNTDATNGSMYLHWLRPSILDSVNYAPPYKLVIRRSTSINGTYQNLDSLHFTSFSNITDSSFIDTFINTSQVQYFYKIDFFSTIGIDTQFIDASPMASSVRASVYSTDRKNILNWHYNVPWINDSVVVYRKNNTNGFDYIGNSTGNSFADTGLYNGTTYEYYLQTFGMYSQIFYSSVLVNNSQKISGTPVDTIPPCPPMLTVTPPCSSFNDFYNTLSWIPDNTCGGDVLYYKIYYKRLKTDSYRLIDSVGKDSLRYIDASKYLVNSIGGCYIVTAVDSSVHRNESPFTNEVCIDNCPRYEIPNVFTPNGDGINDLLNPFPYRFVDKINIIIYDRWGMPVYQTSDLDINWDGRDQASKNKCTEGVYFYICDVYEIFLDGLRQRTIRGTVHLMR